MHSWFRGEDASSETDGQGRVFAWSRIVGGLFANNGRVEGNSLSRGKSNNGTSLFRKPLPWVNELQFANERLQSHGIISANTFKYSLLFRHDFAYLSAYKWISNETKRVSCFFLFLLRRGAVVFCMDLSWLLLIKLGAKRRRKWSGFA